MNALPILVVAILVLTLGYRYYSAFLAAKVMALDDRIVTPAHRLNDGQNYHPTPRWVLFGHHFAAIAGAGPLIGPVLAAQFGWAPGLLWLLLGVVFGGAVHDFIILAASVRRDGRSLAEIARQEINPFAGVTAMLAILFIVVIALAGLGLAVVNALEHSPWGMFTIAATIPLALFMGLYMYRLRPGAYPSGTVVGILGLVAAVVLGRLVPGSAIASWFTFDRGTIVVLLAGYGLVASELPVWMLLCPRDYLSSFLKLGVVAALALGVFLVAPQVRMPAFTPYVSGGGPIIPGKVFPFCFITIACGAISGFHALVSSGTTPKMIARESDIRPIGYGAMLCECFVGVMAFLAVLSLQPADYFAINVPPARFATLGMEPVDLPALSQAVGENVQGRTGGAVSLAVGMAHVFSGVPGLRGLMDYWYHFAIMFEALFILTTIDTGTRVARFLVQEVLGRAWAPMGRADWLPGSVLSSLLVVATWGYFIHTGSVSTIWPMFGIANQLLAAMALAIGTTVILKSERRRYAWVTLVPLSFVAVTTLSAGWLSIRDNFVPMARTGLTSADRFHGGLNAALTLLMMTLILLTIGNCVGAWARTLRPPRRPHEAPA
ncbi:MAG TPA: carbon starvation protein A [Candidatus Polarisedimenticolia bacterium]|nr:carbon starvation protein A [Candidatus Polarisedimenticolia bacterium]